VTRYDPQTANVRELAYCGVFGAAALLFPVLFHVLQLGRLFMPMYLPLVALAFFVRPRAAAATALATPMLSGALTGMPPFYPPVAVLMSLELALTALVLSALNRRFPRLNPWLLLAPVLVGGRCLYVGLVYAFARVVELPAAFVAGASLLSGWPGVVLMLVVIPPLALRFARRKQADPSGAEARQHD
jgi:hypothetical protein